MIGVNGIFHRRISFRCCWTGGHYYDETSGDRFYYPPKFEKMFNGFYVPMEKILSYDYWNKLQNYLQGYERSFKLCKSQCGKTNIFYRKGRENLKKHEKQLFLMHMLKTQHMKT